MSLMCSMENRHGQGTGGAQRTDMDEVNVDLPTRTQQIPSEQLSSV